jgi:hypothetical protein
VYPFAGAISSGKTAEKNVLVDGGNSGLPYSVGAKKKWAYTQSV